jgi:hypothetical protein
MNKRCFVYRWASWGTGDKTWWDRDTYVPRWRHLYPYGRSQVCVPDQWSLIFIGGSSRWTNHMANVCNIWCIVNTVTSPKQSKLQADRRQTARAPFIQFRHEPSPSQSGRIPSKRKRRERESESESESESEHDAESNNMWEILVSIDQIATKPDYTDETISYFLPACNYRSIFYACLLYNVTSQHRRSIVQCTL